MKRLRFETLELLSLRERKARRIEFDPLMTVITGTNDVGKSSVIKSLYWAFGASPSIIHPTWAAANVKAMVTFTIDDVRYRIMRDHNAIGVFDEDGRMLLVTSQITRELAPYLAKLLNFQLVLTNRKGEPEIPPPAYAFLPFYIDQDSGWTRPLDSFDTLVSMPTSGSRSWNFTPASFRMNSTSWMRRSVVCRSTSVFSRRTAGSSRRRSKDSSWR